MTFFYSKRTLKIVRKRCFKRSDIRVEKIQLYLICLNDLLDGTTLRWKIFADDTSLFSKVQDKNKSVNELKCDLENKSNWAYQWKMQFKPDPKTKEMKLSFLENQNQTVFSILLFNPVKIILLNALIKNI